MAWRTKSGQTSDRQLEAATRRGTEVKTGIKNRKADRQALEAGWERNARMLQALNSGDWSVLYED